MFKKKETHKKNPQKSFIKDDAHKNYPFYKTL